MICASSANSISMQSILAIIRHIVTHTAITENMFTYCKRPIISFLWLFIFINNFTFVLVYNGKDIELKVWGTTPSTLIGKGSLLCGIHFIFIITNNNQKTFFIHSLFHINNSYNNNVSIHMLHNQSLIIFYFIGLIRCWVVPQEETSILWWMQNELF